MALSTNFKVLNFYSRFLADGDIAPIMIVFVLPINDYCSKRVSFDYRNIDVFFMACPLVRKFMTFPNVVRDKLMFFSSFKWSSPIAYFLFIFYEPAKSHRLNFDFYIKLTVQCRHLYGLLLLIKPWFGKLYVICYSLHSLKFA